MSQDSNLFRSPDYYSARAVEERRLAMSASDVNVRAIHLQMAEKYDQLAQGGEQDHPQVIGDRRQAN